MREFLLWSEVQEELSRHLARHGEPCSFFDATRILWQQGKSRFAPEVPRVPFLDWNVEDLDQFDRLFGQTGVGLEMFYHAFDRQQEAGKVSELTLNLDLIPYKLAWDQAVGLHKHAFFEVLYVMRGDARLETAAGSRPMPQGTFCIVSPDLPHDAVPEHRSQLVSIAMPVPTFESVLRRLLSQESILSDFFHSCLNERAGYITMTIPEEGRIRTVLRGLFHEFYDPREYTQQICADFVEILFAHMLRLCGDRYERRSEGADRAGAPPILAVLKYIQDNFRTVTLNQLARHFHYEPSYLGKQIKASTGKNYTDLVRMLRLAEAKRLLRATDHALDAVAEEAGYDSRVHFFRSFRAATGQTPGEYRKANAGQVREI